MREFIELTDTELDIVSGGAAAAAAAVGSTVAFAEAIVVNNAAPGVPGGAIQAEVAIGVGVGT